MNAQQSKEIFECNKCGHTEGKEQEVICWECGDGEMIYQRTIWVAAEPLPYPYTRLEKMRFKPWRDSRPPDDLLLNLFGLLFWIGIIGTVGGLVILFE